MVLKHLIDFQTGFLLLYIGYREKVICLTLARATGSELATIFVWLKHSLRTAAEGSPCCGRLKHV